ncbi:FadR/GntR family transcriptional regulator [Telmatospirillum sp.]|uniref:FadR/GntR family transcriptional regulator n=1 Tax=Telmatospirillum sp. TaxID=2079197 RepID=UPI002845481B|nr:FadR/GntR family transcriptional regulator [Telmatospirillum sp.]MDR3435909.1 FadR/GntR family transcriptional regulator [Telmatospirillum sp.]
MADQKPPPYPIAPLAPAISRRSQVIERLGAEIRSGSYKPGDRLPTEQELIARFGVSRTVIREAFASLKAEGLVVTRQGSGAFVAKNPLGMPFRIAPEEMTSLPQILYVLQLRLAVEVEAAGLAAAERDDRCLERMQRSLDRMGEAIRAGTGIGDPDYEFHLAIAAGTGNPYFQRFIHFLRNSLSPGREVNPELKNPEVWRSYFTEVQAQHERLYQTIRDGDGDDARRTMRLHLEDVIEQYRRRGDDGPYAGTTTE